MQKNPVNTPQVSTGFERIEGVRTASLPIDLMVNAATEKQNIGIGYRDSVDAETLQRSIFYIPGGMLYVIFDSTENVSRSQARKHATIALIHAGLVKGELIVRHLSRYLSCRWSGHA